MVTNIKQWLQQLEFGRLADLLIVVAAALLCIMLHECAHGVVAYWLGDRTAKNCGRLSLNPFRHVDVVGLVMMAVAGVGWAKPVPIDMRNFKNPKWGMVLTAAAGPLCNVLVALVAMVPAAVFNLCYQINGGQALYYCWYFFEYVTYLSCGLAIFNLLPIPPLDGSKVVAVFLPQRVYLKWMRYERYGMILLIVLAFLGVLNNISILDDLNDGLQNLLWYVAKFPVKAIMSALYPGISIAYD